MQISSEYNWKKITPDDGHYFFGYYDRNPWNNAIDRHLTLKVGQCERLPLRGEPAEIGLLDGKGNYEPVTTTRAWCHQQGSMELFLPRRENAFIYNDYEEAEDRIVTRIYEPGKGITGRYDKPLYTISPDGRWGVSLDFGRIPRRGYSYADAVLSRDRFPADPDAEGVWLVNLENGEYRLIASYRTMLERHPAFYALEREHIWLNHAIFNCDSTRLLWLFRNCPEPATMKGWLQTWMFTCSLTGEDAECVLPDVYWKDRISHQIWGRTPNEILVDANWDEEGHAAIVFDESRRSFLSKRLSRSHGRMAHMVFSPDGKRILADSYPDEKGFQILHLIDVESGESREIGRFRHRQPPGTTVEVRCDLHPRWSRDGRLVTVDSIHDGKRGVYLLAL